jgi:hypothetical protein
MKQNEAQLLKVGDRVRLIQDRTILDDYSIPKAYAGRIVKLIGVDVGNDSFTFARDPLIDKEQSVDKWIMSSKHIDSIVRGKEKKVKFSKVNVEQLFNDGGNQKLRAEMVTRISAAKRAMDLSMMSTPTDLYKEQMTIVDEQLRQVKLIHKSLKKG